MLYIHAWAEKHIGREMKGLQYVVFLHCRSHLTIVESSKSCLELYNLSKEKPCDSIWVWALVNTVECCVHFQPGNEALFTTYLYLWSLFRLHRTWEVGTFWVNPNPTTNRPCQENLRLGCMWPYNVAPSTHPVLSSAYIYLTLSLFFHFHFQKS